MGRVASSLSACVNQHEHHIYGLRPGLDCLRSGSYQHSDVRSLERFSMTWNPTLVNKHGCASTWIRRLSLAIRFQTVISLVRCSGAFVFTRVRFISSALPPEGLKVLCSGVPTWFFSSTDHPKQPNCQTLLSVENGYKPTT